MMGTNIADEHKRVFATLESGEYANFALFSRFANGEPAAAVAAVVPAPPEFPDGDPGYLIQPLSVSVTPGTRLTDRNDRAA